MQVVVALETRFDETPDGQVWSPPPTEYAFWQRYLDVFDEVRVVARVRRIERPTSGTVRTDGARVSFVRVPYFVGPRQFAGRFLEARRVARQSFTPQDATILRVPGTISTLLAGALLLTGRPYAVEVVGDPYDVFAAGAVRSWLRPLVRHWSCRHLRRQCAGAAAAAYVTEHALQQRYPPRPAAFAIGCSDIDLADEAFVSAPRPLPSGERSHNLVFVGGLQHLYKRPDVLIEAVAANVGRGLDVRLTIVGDGQHRAELEQLAHQRGVADRVRFAGHAAGGAPVRAELDRADLFVLPSRQEGLPRALVEAMARGLPCVSSTVGGIPELLPPEDLVPPGDVASLAAKLHEVLTRPERRAQMATRNLRRARDFHCDVLRPRRRAFYEAVRDLTLDWQRRAGKQR
jgi:glycosyltransferase involved in cell wall biosynthesis